MACQLQGLRDPPPIMTLNYRDHPNHKVRVEANPDHGNDERKGVPVPVLVRSAVGNSQATHVVYGVDDSPRSHGDWSSTRRLVQRIYLLWRRLGSGLRDSYRRLCLLLLLLLPTIRLLVPSIIVRIPSLVRILSHCRLRDSSSSTGVITPGCIRIPTLCSVRISYMVI